MNFSQEALRGAEIWHIWRQHHVIECFWKIMKSIFHMRSMQLQGDGLYTALLIKVFAYVLAPNLDTVSFTYMRSAADCILTTSQSVSACPRSDKDRLV